MGRWREASGAVFSRWRAASFCPFLSSLYHLLAEGHVLLVELPLLPSRVLGNEDGFDKPVQLVEQDVAEDGAHNRALWDAAEGSVVLPVLEISGIEQLVDEVEKAPVVDLFAHVERSFSCGKDPKQSEISPSMIQVAFPQV